MSGTYDEAALLAWRAERDREFTDFASPLPEEERAGFTGLRYCPPHPDWTITGPFTPDTTDLTLTQSDGTAMRYLTAGTVRLILGGSAHDLLVFEGDGEHFLPFSDAMPDVYGGGRYAPVAVHDDGTVTVDFNRAVNPLCAYDAEFSCPLPPPQNRLQLAVPAGELDYVPPSTRD